MNSRKKTILIALAVLLMIMDVIMLVFIFVSPGTGAADNEPAEGDVVSSGQLIEPVLSDGDILLSDGDVLSNADTEE